MANSGGTVTVDSQGAPGSLPHWPNGAGRGIYTELTKG